MPDIREQTVVQTRRWLRAGRLHALIDACDAPSVPVHARECIERRGAGSAVSLYRGRAEEDLWAIAPYLFQVDESVFDWIISDLWSTPWGCFVLSDESNETLRKHFRRFLTVKTPEGEELYFRFYDPRVMRTYLGTCTRPELDDFFGPARALAVTNAETYGVDVFSLPVVGGKPVPRVALVP